MTLAMFPGEDSTLQSARVVLTPKARK